MKRFRFGSFIDGVIMTGHKVAAKLGYNYILMELNSYDDEVVEDVLNRWLLMFLETDVYDEV